MFDVFLFQINPRLSLVMFVSQFVMTKNREIPPMHPASAVDFLPLAQLRDVQFTRLKFMVQRAYDHVALFRKRMDERKLKPADLRTMDDIVKLPFTVKTDLRDTYPFGWPPARFRKSCVSTRRAAPRANPSSWPTRRKISTTGRGPMLRSFAACGVHSGDIVQNAYGYGLFTGGLGAHYGAEALGASVIPISGGNTDRQIMLMKDFGVTVICCTPSYFLHIIDRAKKWAWTSRNCRCASACSAPSRGRRTCANASKPGAASRLTTFTACPKSSARAWRWNARTRPARTFSRTCSFPEIIDPKTLEPLPDGTEGELVLTTLCKRAMPMIRYRTRDITSLEPARCACGRTLRRIRRIGRRSDDMLIIRGVNLFPSQIEAALLKVEGTLPHYQIIVDRQKGPRHAGSAGGGDQRGVQRHGGRHGTVAETAGAFHRSHHRPASGVKLVAPRTIQRSEGKAKRVIDKRIM
jgi:phenylacetate-CoA ligase